MEKELMEGLVAKRVLGYDHDKLARMYMLVVRDFAEMQTAVVRIMQESTDPVAVKIARDAFMCVSGTA